MNYHNFASRLSVQRLRVIAPAKEPSKSTTKSARRPPRRRGVPAAALAALCCLALHAQAAAPMDGAPIEPPPAWRINLPTLLVTLTGLGVALLRLPTLWRRDLDC